MDILNYYALIIFLLLCAFLFFQLNYYRFGRAHNLFSLISLILIVTLIFNLSNKTNNVTLYSLLTFYIGLLLLLLRNYFTHSLGKKIGRMFTTVHLNKYRLRRRIGLISIICGLLYIVLSYFNFNNYYVLYISVWTLMPLLGILTIFIIIKYSNLKEV